jgi:hypothetical protein
MKIQKLKITVDQVSTIDWLRTFIKESTQNKVKTQNDYLIVESESNFDIFVQTTEKVAMALLRKNLNITVEEVPTA